RRGPSFLMIDDKRKRGRFSQNGHDFSRDLTPIAPEGILAGNIGRAQKRLFAFASFVRYFGEDCGIRPTSVRPLGQTPAIVPRAGDVAALSRTKHRAQTA